MTKGTWEQDLEYLSYVGELLQEPAVQKLAQYEQHHATTRLDHCISVSYTSYLIAKKMHLNAKATARAGLLHDLFYYDWRTTKFDRGTHAWIHPRIAVRNAEKITTLTPLEKDIIIKHMWGATVQPPKYLEGWIVTTVDKYSASTEYTGHLLDKITTIFKQRLNFAKVSK
ncbi:HD family hydrolase [Ligilactobacillus salitolerans]|uniref:HD family hydrolase n=1 Tax=Ligilactobacillus salitolerans TaxID=1808352 RepID=A0A401ITX7_9LACO|nr:HD domain-containing protein [Ligilactobacillus salitolerans]GBG94991.1 HD family hydrolase [Ligilactobacillus salitolerans]